MNGFQEAVRSGLEESLQALYRGLEGLTPAELHWQATLHTNPIAWLVWHMARVEDMWMSRLRQSPQLWSSGGWADRFHMDPASVGFGNTMEEVRAMPDIAMNELRAYLEAVRSITRVYLVQATDADLLREYPHPRLGAVTGTWIIGHILTEESQHIGQVALLRGMMRGFGG